MYSPKIYFSSDHHFNHANVIKYDNRPFKSVEEMNKKLIFNHNQMVKKEDLCFFLGDICLRSGKEGGKSHYLDFLLQLTGRITLIQGNHCKRNGVTGGLQSASMYLSGINIFLVHDPIYATTKYDLVLHGHTHSMNKAMILKESGKETLLVNVGINAWEYRPIEWEKIYALYMRWKKGLITPEVFDKKALAQHRQNRKR